MCAARQEFAGSIFCFIMFSFFIIISIPNNLALNKLSLSGQAPQRRRRLSVQSGAFRVLLRALHFAGNICVHTRTYICRYAHIYIRTHAYGCLWIPLDSYGFLGIPLASYGFLWITMDSYWIPMESYGFLWTSLWIHMDAY